MNTAMSVMLNNGMMMPMVGFGTWDLNGAMCEQGVEEAIRLGYRLIDTAQMYGNEKEVGQGIRKSQISREEIFITTKMCRNSNSYEKAKNAIDKSLIELQLDYVDLYMIHEPYDEAPDMCRALLEAQEEGKVKAIGISNYNRRRYDQFIKECGVIPAVNQIESHVFYPQWELASYMREKGTHPQAWGPLAQGKNHIFSNPVLVGIAKVHEKSVSQIALRYLVQNGISVVPKSKNAQRMIQNKDIFDFDLSINEIEQIGRLNAGKSLSNWTKNWE